MRFERAFGVLLHPTSLPGPFGIGDIGPAADRYLDFLQRAGAGWWQVLPLSPTGGSGSPYSATSSFAGNAHLVSPELLVEDGLLTMDDLAAAPHLDEGAVDREGAAAFKEELLRRAWRRFRAASPGVLGDAFVAYRAAQAHWLDAYVAYVAVKRAEGGAPWWRWPRPLARREPAALADLAATRSEELAAEAFAQFLFHRQWRRLRARARAAGVRILGDLPIFVARDSADVWAHPEVFRLDAEGEPLAMAGVPPDYFSENGQLWGNPLYDWDHLAATGYAWWVERLRANLSLVDALRLDHFRGFAAFWEVPAGARTARLGRWAPGPGVALFDAFRAALGEVALVAEDLGYITEDVLALRDRLELPGMAVLHFAFNPRERSLFLPYLQRANQVVYTGTHDNNTTQGWYHRDAPEAERDFARRYMATDGREIHWDLIRLAMSTVADLAIVPHQDVVGLGAEARMNTPGEAEGNWGFRLAEWMVDGRFADRLHELAWIFGRLPAAPTP